MPNTGLSPRPKWGVETAIYHLATLIEANDRRYQEHFAANKEMAQMALTSAKEALDKALIANNSRLDGLNELRDMAADQASKFMSREMALAMFDALENKVALMESRLDKSEGRSYGTKDLYGYAAGVIGIVIAAVSFIVNYLRK